MTKSEKTLYLLNEPCIIKTVVLVHQNVTLNLGKAFVFFQHRLYNTTVHR